MNDLTHDLLVRPSLKFWLMHLCLFVVLLIVLISGFVIFPEFVGLITIWRIVLVLGSSVLLYSYIKHRTTTYSLNSIELVSIVGVFTRKISRIPINRITNYDFRASFLDRLLGIGDVLIDTPGGTGYEMEIKAISLENSEKIMKHLGLLIAQQKIADADTNKVLKAAIEEDITA